jgi:hypothetical protein
MQAERRGSPPALDLSRDWYVDCVFFWVWTIQT